MCSSSGCGRGVKYEEVYLRAYESVPEARTGLGRYFEFRGSLTHGSVIPLTKPGSAVQTNETTSTDVPFNSRINYSLDIFCVSGLKHSAAALGLKTLITATLTFQIVNNRSYQLH